MTERELEYRLKQAVLHTAPDDVGEVLSRCVAQKGDVPPMTKKTSKRNVYRGVIAACLALALVGGGAGAVYQQSGAVASVVSLDVNPSLELTVNKKEKVIEAQALNEEAKLVLNGMDLEGASLTVAVNALVGSMLRNGYLENVSSAILISVEDKDPQRAARLQRELTGEVDTVLQAQSAQAAVLSQTVAKDVRLERLAREHNVSTGKAALINRVLEKNSALKFSALSVLSVEELKDLLEAGVPGMPIGTAGARISVENYAGVVGESTTRFDVDPELDDASPHYEVELWHPRFGEFEYRVDAYTGKILSGQQNITGQAQQDLPHIRPMFLEVEKARRIALEYAGVKESDLSAIVQKEDWDDGRLEYEFEFIAGGVKYECTVDAGVGAVVEFDRETAGKQPTQSQNSGDVGKDGAKQAALSHAGLKESQVSGLRVEQDREDGRLEYEVDFRFDGMEYDYTIDAATGSVLEHEKDYRD